MNESLKILEEQIKYLIIEYNDLVYDCNNILEFSDFTVMSKQSNIHDKILTEKLNIKIKKINKKLLTVKKIIEKL